MDPVSNLKLFYAHTGQFFVAIDKKGIIYTESPNEQGLSDKVPQESLLRVFMTVQDVTAYCAFLNAELTGVKSKHTDLVTIWGLLQRIDALSMKRYDCPVRVDVCTIDKDGWPESIDTLHSIYMLPH